MDRSAPRSLALLLVLLTPLAVPSCAASRRPALAQCALNSDCQDDLVCAGGTCRTQCAQDRDCPAGFTCGASGRGPARACLPPRSPYLCAFNSECPVAARCIAGNCRPECRTARDCSELGLITATCDDGVCSEPLLTPAYDPDAGRDAGRADAAPPDLGPPDFGPPDLGPPDLGPPDLGPPDVGPSDSGLGCGANVFSDPANCGFCGNACSAGELCAGGFCTLPGACDAAVLSDPTNCGMCGRRCPIPGNAAALCMSGQCGLRCDPAYLDCDSMVATGCEQRVLDDEQHCGSCTNVCTAGTTCEGGRCVQSAFPSTGAEGDFMPTMDTRLTPGVHQFQTITIPMGVTVRVDGTGVLDLRATGAVRIAGTVDVSGGNGAPGQITGGGGATGTGVAGIVGGCPPGGAGGLGGPGGDAPGRVSTCGDGGKNGGGAGGSRAGTLHAGGGGGYAGGAGGECCGGVPGLGGSAAGGTGGATPGAGGERALMNVYSGRDGGLGSTSRGGGGGSIGAPASLDLAVATTFQPGSGGGGGGAQVASGGDVSGGGGGGGGGGALRIASPVSITVTATGALRANGGNGGNAGNFSSGGGGGSGGVIYLSSPTIELAGSVSAIGGTGGGPGAGAPTGSFGGAGGLGRIRISTVPLQCVISGVVRPAPPSACELTPVAVPGSAFVGLYPD